MSGGILVAQANQAPAAEDQPSAVEDYSYPGREKILAEDNVKLVSGDGHIIYADCDQPPTGPIGLIEVHSTDITVGKGEDGVVCFKVIGSNGFLTLLLPDVFEVYGDGRQPGTGHKGKAEVVSQSSGQHKIVDLNPSGSAQVGVGSPGGEPSTLLRLEITG